LAKVKGVEAALKSKLSQYEKEALQVLADRIEEPILASIRKGVSPVGGKKFAKYSKSYKDAIKGKSTFRNKKGTNQTFEITNKDKVYDYTSEFRKYGKRIAPINLKLSGKMLNSFFVKLNKDSLELGFDNEVATFHNRKGAGKSKVIRRLLPRRGEFFNDVIVNKIRLAFKVASRKLRGK